MLQQVTINNLTPADVEKIKAICEAVEVKRVATWNFPIGDSKVTLTIEGPVHSKESDVLQYAIDMLEVAKKNSMC